MRRIKASSRFSGGRDFPMYVDRLVGTDAGIPPRLVMIHGACNTGACFLVTPDGRPGWAHDFAEAGYDTYVVDWPGHGRSPMRPGFMTLSTRDVRDAVAGLLREIGPSILLAHSAGGPIAWSLAESVPHLVRAIIGVAPGPPANLVGNLPPKAEALEAMAKDSESGLPISAPVDELFYVDLDFVQRHWFTGAQAPIGAAEHYYRMVVPESPRVINERFNIEGQGVGVSDVTLIGNRPILIVTPDSDPRHPRSLDAKTASLFGADFVWLADQGILGNGHMLMGDRNSFAISNLMTGWLRSVGMGVNAHARKHDPTGSDG